MAKGKNYKTALGKKEVGKEYALEEGVALVQEMSYTKFDSSLEGHFNVKYKSLQNVRGTVQLPHGTGKTVKVLVFAKGEKAEDAKNAGADYVGDNELIEKIKGGWIDFDFVVATPDMMKEVGKLGPVLGKKGLMPKPKSGTVTNDVSAIIKQLKSGRVEYKADKGGVIHMGLGKLSFTANQLAENIKIIYDAIMKGKPSDAKGEFVTAVSLAGSMTPGVKINIKELRS